MDTLRQHMYQDLAHTIQNIGDLQSRLASWSIDTQADFDALLEDITKLRERVDMMRAAILVEKNRRRVGGDG